MRLIGHMVSYQNYPGGPGPAHASPCSGLKQGLNPGKILQYPISAGLYARSPEGLNLAGMDKPAYERSGGGPVRGYISLSLYQVHGGLKYNIYILRQIKEVKGLCLARA